MGLSTFDIFKIGIGPSSSHTIGPMNAARQFALDLEKRALLDMTAQVSVQLFGSLALTGMGHCTDRAVLLGLEGAVPAEIDPDQIDQQLQRIRDERKLLRLAATKSRSTKAPDSRITVIVCYPDTLTACGSGPQQNRGTSCWKRTSTLSVAALSSGAMKIPIHRRRQLM